MLHKAHLTSYSRASGSTWATTVSWLSRSLSPFLYSSSVYYCHLFLISSASVRSLPFLSFIVPIVTWNVPLVSPIFLKWSLVFPILLFSSISLHCLRRPSYLSLLFLGFSIQLGISFLSPLPFAFLLSLAICKVSSDNHFAFLHFFFFRMVLVMGFVHVVLLAKILEWVAIYYIPQCTTIFQYVWPICLGWPCMAWLITSVSYSSPFTMTRLWSPKEPV